MHLADAKQQSRNKICVYRNGAIPISSTLNVAGTYQVPSATETPVFADGTQSVPATIGRKVDGIGREPSGIEESESLRSSATIEIGKLFRECS